MPSSGSPSGSGQTEAERRAAIDRKMDESLGTFDASLRKERERIARERDAQTTGSGSGAGTEAGGDSSSAGAGGKEGEGADASQTGGDLKSEGAATATTANAGQGGTVGGGSAGSGSGAAGRDIPDGRDDDIIARQIREAAEKETDPELKEKLWQEYTNYKKNVQKK